MRPKRKSKSPRCHVEELTLCPMLDYHADQVLEIDQLAFPEDPQDWGTIAHVAKHQNGFGFVSLCGPEVVAYLLGWRWGWVAWTIEAIAVHPSTWRRGIGCRFINRVSKLISRYEVTACTTENNLDACLFFQSIGFTGKAYGDVHPATGEPQQCIEFKRSIKL